MQAADCLSLTAPHAVACLLLLGTTGAAAAPCAGSQLTGSELADYVTDALICAYEPGTDGSDAGKRWSEQHLGGGTLREYARGPSHPVDKSKDVGTWAINADAIDYGYGGGSSYSFSLYQDGSTVQFCTLDATPQQVSIVHARVEGTPSGDDPCNWSGAAAPSCHVSCLTCDGPGYDQCTACGENRYLFEGVCSCVDGYRQNEDNSACISDPYPTDPGLGLGDGGLPPF